MPTRMVLPCRYQFLGWEGMDEIPFHLVMVPHTPVLFIIVGQGSKFTVITNTLHKCQGVMRASVSMTPLPVLGTLYRSLKLLPDHPSQ